LCEPLIPPLISQLLVSKAMLFSVGFNHEPGRLACEVGDERTDRDLAAELVAKKSTAAKVVPEPIFGSAQNLPLLSSTLHAQRMSHRFDDVVRRVDLECS
jgi:hypothetical protein